MSAIKHYFEELATRATDAVWTEVMNESDRVRTSRTEVEIMVTETVFGCPEDLFDDLWTVISNRKSIGRKLPKKTYAVCKELAQWMPEHLDTIWDLNPDLTPIE